MTGPDSERRAQLVGSVAAVRRRIADACAAVGRDPRAVTVIAVTKTYPAADIATLSALGLHDFGESRDQEARAKIAELGSRGGSPIGGSAAEIRWHVVGRLQTNKARSVVTYAHAVHSLDRSELVSALAAAAERADRAEPLEVFVQVSLDGDPERGGASAAQVSALAEAVTAAPRLRLRGVMAVAPIGAEPQRAFGDLAGIAAALQARFPEADAISAGMSGDLEAAVENGATHVRVGTALLGLRGDLFG